MRRAGTGDGGWEWRLVAGVAGDGGWGLWLGVVGGDGLVMVAGGGGCMGAVAGDGLRLGMV